MALIHQARDHRHGADDQEHQRRQGQRQRQWRSRGEGAESSLFSKLSKRIRSHLILFKRDDCPKLTGWLTDW